MAESPNTDVRFQIQLGDIIEIEAPTDPDLNEKQFYVAYAAPQLIKLISGDSDKEVDLPLTEDGSFRNEAISGISILSRADSPSYAVQNGLLPGEWVDIYFDGDVPTVLTGKITNLEEDMIELTLLDSNDVIYIDFGYKGIPLDLSIDKIVQRDAPESVKKEEVDESEEKEVEVLTPPSDDLVSEKEQIMPVSEVKEQIRQMFLQADQIQIGEELGAITQEVQVPEAQQRFGIEKQTTDMLDEMLSSIPNIQRTRGVLNAIHTEIERFKQLRTEFSIFDDRGNALLPAKQGAGFKPLVNSLKSFDQQLFWLLPVVRDTKKLYDVDQDIVDETADVQALTLAETRIEEDRIIDSYLDNDVPDGENNYAYLIRSLRPYLTPFGPPSQPETCIAHTNVSTNITGTVDNLDDYYSSVAHNDAVKRKRFYLQRYNLGQDSLESHKNPSGDVVVRRRRLTQPDMISIRSLLFLPESTVSFSRINLPSTSVMTRADLNQNFLQYWAFLNQFSIVSTTIIDDTATPLEHDPATFLRGIAEYTPDAVLAASDDVDKYHKFLETVIPKTRVLFELIKPYLQGKLSLYEVVAALEPFMVYHRDISFKQYEEMTTFIQEKIAEYKKRYARRSREIASLSRTKSKGVYPRLIGLLDKDPGLKEAVIDGYGLSKLPLDNMTDGELIRMINSIDYGVLLDAALALASTHLMVSGGLDKLADLGKWAESAKTASNSSECPNLILAKKYFALDELEEDDNKTIYFDKQFDKTYYDLKDEYQTAIDAELARVPPGADLQAASIKILATLLATGIGLASRRRTTRRQGYD